MLSNVVSDLKSVNVHQDDHIIHGSEKVAGDRRLTSALHHLSENDITVNPDKCSFCVCSFECMDT